jgi:carboxyl-terminal processing protease
LVVLIDEDSASASEIFAGAMHDHSRGTIVGQTSYGKGSVQGVFHNERGNGGLRLTVSKFYSPNGTPISANGIHPNVPVPVEPNSNIAPTLDKMASERLALRPSLENGLPVAAVAKVDLTKERGIEMARKKIMIGR